MFELDDIIPLGDKPNDLLAVGELLIDMISNEYDDGSFECDGYTKFSGGAPSNIAINVNRLGIRSEIVSAVGSDGLGTFLLRRLQQEGMETKSIQRVDASTSLVVVTKSRTTPVPIFYRDADYQMTFDASLEQKIANSKVVHFSCWPISRTPARHTLEKVIEEARSQGLLIGFDPNYHPMIWQRGEDGAQYVKSIISKVDVIKPSEDDAERLFGKDEPIKQLEKFLELGAKLVIMTLGKDGAIVSNGRETFSFDSLATEVVDTTGAGDAFWSGFYAALIKGHSIREALHLGFAVSAYKLRFTGAVVHLPRLDVIKKQFSL
ncbi:carbohydrate kinase family protein [Paenibacillus woosongensis]|uniref:Carbohydrate kinase n=1 Tax=Paenibacillus woosongensis TaxID=307580 RepID=A0A7X2Z3D2_9BACL|nr:carbohydrate kinase [Paenibacillus woosongensis]MUG46253.1 carbohydrate kinase [Paenibacillus woosongensis]